MKEALLSLLLFGVVVVALLNLYPKEVVREVVKEVPTVVVKERVVVQEVVKETPIIYQTVNHYHNDNRRVVHYRQAARPRVKHVNTGTRRRRKYYQPTEEPRIQRVGYVYYEPVKEEKEVSHEEITERRHVEKPKVRMFLVDGIREPLWVEGGKDD